MSKLKLEAGFILGAICMSGALILGHLTCGPTIEPHFDDCREAIVNEINRAHDAIHSQAYGFTNARILKALERARDRGVNVSVLLDKSGANQHNYSAYTFCENEGFNVWIDPEHPIAHNKIMIIDNVVVTGSFNFTKAAERNAENIVIIRGSRVASDYLKNWNVHRGHSK